ncbi:MAG: hypothetical protein CVU98_04540 [Firmicutes bacterium HGW-Firmicutes-3]|jgi:capsular polysaccharide biosynthesis protein|nr:MAG: hypothetical protein CVU98_04540 [Firmicutes bacterium HGW-Firmicutes-3]
MNEEYQELDLVELLRGVVSNWWLILLFMIIAAGSSYYATKTYVVPIYKAESTLFIGKENNVLSGISLGDFQLDSKLVIDYRELIKTRLVTEEVISDLELKSTRNEVISNLRINIITESRFMNVTYQDPIPERATQIVNRFSQVLVEKAETIVGVNNIQIVDYAITPTTPISPNPIMNAMIAAMVGAMVAMGIILLKMAMNNTIKDESSVEKEFGIPVLGVIPKFKGEGRTS